MLNEVKLTVPIPATMRSLAASLLGLSIYLYLPWRYQALPAFNYAGHYDATGVFVPVNLWTPTGLWWLISGRAFAGELLSQRRYMWILFPAFILLARWGEHSWVDRGIITISLLGLALFTAMFANWYWVA